MSEIKDPEIKTSETVVDTGKETGGESSKETKDTVIDQAKEQGGFSENAGARSAIREVSMHGNRWKAVGAAAQLSLALLSSSVGGKFIAVANPNLAPIVEVANYANEVLEEAYDPTKEKYENKDEDKWRHPPYTRS